MTYIAPVAPPVSVPSTEPAPAILAVAESLQPDLAKGISRSFSTSVQGHRTDTTFRDAQPEGQPDQLGLPVGASRPELNRMLQDLREQDVPEQDGPGWHRNGAALRLIAE